MGEGLAWEPGAATWGCRKQGTDKPRPASPQAKGDRETYPARRPGDHGGRTEKTIPAPGDLTSDGLPALSPSPLGPRSTVRQLPWPLAPLSLSPPGHCNSHPVSLLFFLPPLDQHSSHCERENSQNVQNFCLRDKNEVSRVSGVCPVPSLVCLVSRAPAKLSFPLWSVCFEGCGAGGQPLTRVTKHLCRDPADSTAQ